MTELQKSIQEFGQACGNFAIAFSKWIKENAEIITRIFPIMTNNGRKRYGLPMYRNQAIKRAKKNRRKVGGIE